MQTYHITRITRRAGRRINDTGGTRVNLCGGPLTDHDCTIADARRVVRTGWQKAGWTRCDACFGQLLALDFARSTRVED